MKRLFAALLTLFFFGQLSAQTINLGIDANCRSLISLDKTRLKKDSLYSIPVPANGALKFKLSNPLNKKITISISGIMPNDARSIELKPEFFTNNFLSTDANLILTVDGKSFDLRKPFNISMGCSDGAFRALANTVNFQIDKQLGQVSNGTNGASGTTTLSGTAGIPVLLVQAAPAGQNKGAGADDTEQAYQPGSAVYDALKLTDPTKVTEEDFKKIIKFYVAEGVPVGSPAAGIDAVKGNPFLKDIINTTYTGVLIKPLDAAAESGSDILSSLSLSSIGGLDVTQIADGLAKFLVKRTKEELSISFFNKFKELLDRYPDLKTVFPKTYMILQSIGDEIYNYEKYIQNLREAFKDDIQHLADNLPGIVDNHLDFFTKYHTVAASLKTGCYLATELQKQVHPGDILANYPMEFLKDENGNVAGSIQTLQLLSASFRDTSAADSSYWVNLKYIRQLVNNKTAFRIYLGLVYQMAILHYDNVHFKDTTLVGYLDKAAPEIIKGLDIFNQYKLYILRFAEKTDNLNRMIKSYSRPANDSLAIELYKKYFDGFVDYFEYAVQVGKLPLINENHFFHQLSRTLTPYFSVANLASDLVVDINRKNYSSAINNAVAIYTVIWHNPNQEAINAAKASAAKTNTGKDKKVEADKEEVTVNEDSVAKSFQDSKEVLPNFIKYGSFMASIATAKNSDEVASAIEAAALPSGSSRIKRESLMNVSLNAFTGLYIGHESIKGIKDGTVFNTFGVTAPIGVALSWGHQLLFWNTPKCGWSTSLFISIIDIGALASYRFKNDTTSQVPTVELKNILSPGAFLSIGVPKTPISFNFGAQMGPNLRKVNFNSSLPSDDSNNKIYLRFSASVCVDIPLLNFYTKSK
ncbi:hypothetical protein ACX0G9_25500 [Flavitalea flava]